MLLYNMYIYIYMYLLLTSILLSVWSSPHVYYSRWTLSNSKLLIGVNVSVNGCLYYLPASSQTFVFTSSSLVWAGKGSSSPHSCKALVGIDNEWMHGKLGLLFPDNVWLIEIELTNQLFWWLEYFCHAKIPIKNSSLQHKLNLLSI